MEKTGLTVSDTAKMEHRRRDSERVKQAEGRVQDQHKKYRVALRQAKQHEEDLRIRCTSVTYETGAFGETEPCNEPQKRPRNNFGHTCFKIFLPTYCVFLFFQIFFPATVTKIHRSILAKFCPEYCVVSIFPQKN